MVVDFIVGVLDLENTVDFRRRRQTTDECILKIDGKPMLPEILPTQVVSQ